MSLTAQKLAAALFGFEVASPDNQNKNLLSQCAQAMRANGITAPDPIPAVGENLIDTEYRWLQSLLAAAVPTKAAHTFTDSGTTKLLTVTAKAAGYAGNSITVTIAAGTDSGKKVTVTDGVTPEVYDDQADVATIAASISGGALANGTAVASGTLANISATHLAGGGGATVTAPTFAAGANDGQTAAITAWGKALFAALQSAGYMS